MDSQYTADSLLVPLRRYLTKPQWQNLVVLVVALQLARTLILRQAAVCMVCVRQVGAAAATAPGAGSTAGDTRPQASQETRKLGPWSRLIMSYPQGTGGGGREGSARTGEALREIRHSSTADIAAARPEPTF